MRIQANETKNTEHNVKMHSILHMTLLYFNPINHNHVSSDLN